MLPSSFLLSLPPVLPSSCLGIKYAYQELIIVGDQIKQTMNFFLFVNFLTLGHLNVSLPFSAVFQYLADPGKARGCSTKTFVINCFSDSVIL